jgi:hypothetical protein
MLVRIEGIVAHIIVIALAMLLALWIYAAWLDIQPQGKPSVWHDKPRHVICYWTRHNLTCIPEPDQLLTFD